MRDQSGAPIELKLLLLTSRADPDLHSHFHQPQKPHKRSTHLPPIMAKSTRSKVKRAHRAKKREDSVYAAAESARLQRLNAKLVGLTTQDPPTEEVSEDEEEGGEDEKMQGMSWFACLGLLDQDGVGLDALEMLGSPPRALESVSMPSVRARSGCRTLTCSLKR